MLERRASLRKSPVARTKSDKQTARATRASFRARFARALVSAFGVARTARNKTNCDKRSNSSELNQLRKCLREQNAGAAKHKPAGRQLIESTTHYAKVCFLFWLVARPLRACGASWPLLAVAINARKTTQRNLHSFSN